MKLWKLDQKLKSFALLGTIPVLGVVNSLQFVSPPGDFLSAAAWAAPASAEADNDGALRAKRARGAASILLVAGVGQEMRAGRWVCRKGEGHINGAVVFALHPWT